MPHRTVNLLRTLLLAVAAGLGPAAGAHAAAPPPPLEHFFGNPEFSGAALSPSGRFLAMRVGGPNARTRLTVLDLGDYSIKVAAQFTDADVGNFEWISERRLVLNTTDKQIGQGDARYEPGLYAVNRDGGDFRQLAEHVVQDTAEASGRRRLLPWHTFLSGQRGAQDGDSVYVLSGKYDDEYRLDYVNLLLLNTATGQARAVERPGNTRRWLLDHRGEPRVATTLDANIATVFYRDPASAQWRKLAQFDAYLGGADSFEPLAFGPDGTFYVVSNMGGDRDAVYVYDLAAKRIVDKPVVSLAGYDFNGALITANGRLLGIRHVGDAEETTWFDPAMRALQKQVDALLPATINLITPAPRPETPQLLVASYSDRQPLKYALFNSESGALNEVGATYPAIQANQMATEQLVHYAARDGLQIPAWLTLPGDGRGKGWPLVVLVNSNPYERGHAWGWDAKAQFLASRGYAVLQPEFRGSIGFGDKHFRAGWKQWGLKMQDDLADGAKWAIAQGYAAPGRVCIAGASYGGYAALMGLANDPGLYQCGVSWAGFTDIALLYTGHWSSASALSEGWKQYGMPELLGDPVRDAAQLAATSPLRQAARIKRPLLLAYGGADRFVPLQHGKQLRDAVAGGNPGLEWLAYEEEGSDLASPKNRIDFWRRVEKFLARHIGKP